MNKIDLFSHQMNETELAEAKLCDEILKAFQGSYKPPCFSGSIGVSLTTFYVEGCGYITLYHKGITTALRAQRGAEFFCHFITCYKASVFIKCNITMGKFFIQGISYTVRYFILYNSTYQKQKQNVCKYIRKWYKF